jgi:uncharacterized protein YjbI with pentapeptide repeats
VLKDGEDFSHYTLSYYQQADTALRQQIEARHQARVAAGALAWNEWNVRFARAIKVFGLNDPWISFAHAEFINADFRGFQFAGAVEFSQVRFIGMTHFENSAFAGDVHFSASEFMGSSHFDQAEFSAYADFRGAKFHGASSFDRAKFYANARFSDARFAGNASFERTIFTGYAMFSDEKIIGYIVLP